MEINVKENLLSLGQLFPMICDESEFFLRLSLACHSLYACTRPMPRSATSLTTFTLVTVAFTAWNTESSDQTADDKGETLRTPDRQL